MNKKDLSELIKADPAFAKKLVTATKTDWALIRKYARRIIKDTKGEITIYRSFKCFSCGKKQPEVEKWAPVPAKDKTKAMAILKSITADKCIPDSRVNFNTEKDPDWDMLKALQKISASKEAEKKKNGSKKSGRDPKHDKRTF